jgi:hypothetical protein
MAKPRTKTAEATADNVPMAQPVEGLVEFPPQEPDVFDQAIAQQQATQVVQQVATATAMPTTSHAAAVERKKPERPKDPFGFEGMKAGEPRPAAQERGRGRLRHPVCPQPERGQGPERRDLQQDRPASGSQDAEGRRLSLGLRRWGQQRWLGQSLRRRSLRCRLHRGTPRDEAGR